MARAIGTFEVKITPLPPDDPTPESQGEIPLARLALDKQFHGDIEAISRGQMYAAGTGVKGSAGYVALERVSGALQGRSGSFVLQHSGTMNRGTPTLSITVVPDSGTGDLGGLHGKMKVDIVEGKHFYEFEYSLTE